MEALATFYMLQVQCDCISWMQVTVPSEVWLMNKMRQEE